MLKHTTEIVVDDQSNSARVCENLLVARAEYNLRTTGRSPDGRTAWVWIERTSTQSHVSVPL